MLFIDTHILLWFLQGNKRLKPEIMESIEDALIAEVLAISAMTVYELGAIIKKGKAEISMPLKDIIDELEDDGLNILPVTGFIAMVADSFDGIHKDPFDRIIAASAISKSAPLVTADEKLKRYPIDIIGI